MAGFRLVRTATAVVSFVLAMGAAGAASAAEYPIGKPQIQGGMEVGAVYLQPITMDPEGMMRKASDSDIHLEADIHAVKNNPTGFAEGDWMPCLQVRYELTKPGSNYVQKGDLMAMVASDGPHYGDNVKLAGPGKYHLKLFIAPPAQTGHMAFGRHVDKETGVGPWFKPFELNYDFPFAGIGKKGGY
ncbi:iron transporter [Mycetohabitans sp. B46]|uniref:iron transporter n=1 Tax=Mycetohabitans sp. B46 TaxID=2772536 RepID=UPI003FD02C23